MAAAAPLFIAASAFSALESFQASQQAAEVADFNAAIVSQQAASERQFAEAEEQRARRQGRLRQGASRAAAGASGVTLGSFGDILTDEAIENELEALTIRATGERRAVAQEQQASGFRMQASQTREAAPLSALGSAFRAGGPAIASRIKN